MPKSKAELEEGRRPYLEIKQLKALPGWARIQSLLTNEFEEAIEKASESKDENERAEARGTIKFIKRFTTSIDSDMSFGETYQKEYVARFINPPKDKKSE